MSIKSEMVKSASKASLHIRKASPQILIGAGIVSMLGSTVLACKAVMSCDDVLNDAKQNLANIEEAKGLAAQGKVEYTDKQVVQDKTIAYSRAIVGFGKKFLPAAILAGAGVACILGGTHILNKRHAAVVAVLAASEESFRSYRDRIAERFGDDVEKEIRLGGVKQDKATQKTVVDESTGEESVVESHEDVVDPSKISVYAKFFDELNPNWEKDPDYNRMFLQAQQNYANDRLHSHGHIFLNEVYDMLGMEHTQAGSVVGWIDSENGDGFVDFGIFDPTNEAAREFVNGYERSILLDFNVDGVIWNLI